MSSEPRTKASIALRRTSVDISPSSTFKVDRIFARSFCTVASSPPNISSPRLTVSTSEAGVSTIASDVLSTNASASPLSLISPPCLISFRSCLIVVCVTLPFLPSCRRPSAISRAMSFSDRPALASILRTVLACPSFANGTSSSSPPVAKF